MDKKDVFEIVTLKLFLYFVVFVIIGMAALNFFDKLNEMAGLENDNIYEQSIEDIIENETGIKIDLTK